MKRKKRKTRLRVLRLIVLFVVVVGVLFLGVKFFSKPKNTAPKVVDSIEEFMYSLEDRDTALMKDVYNELKDILKNKEINKEEYAKVLTKLFIIDLFTINNKANKYDVGGVEYVYPTAQANFKVNAMDTLYKLVKTNSDGKRKQELPVVKSVTIENVEKSTFTIGEDKTLDAFLVTVSWDYEKEIGYDKKGIVTTVVENDRIYVVEYKTGE